MAEMTQIGAQLRQFWASRTVRQRILLGATAAASIGLVALFANLMAKPDYKPLIGGLESSDAQTIAADLKAKNILFQMSADGKSISVPADKLDAARMELASSQSTHSGRMGYEIFDKVSWGQTEFDEKVNYQRALEGELERTITTLSGVKSARVHLVMAAESVFIDRDRGAKASVTLKLARGGLTREETASIQRLVSGAVEGLKPTDVSIIDADSNEPLNASSDSNGEEGMERQLTQRLMATLGPVLGADHLRASVNVEYDTATTEQSQDKFDPAVSAPLSIQRSEESSGGKAAVGGVPGTTSNVPKKLPNVPPPTGTNDDGGAETAKTESATYGVNKTSTHSVQPAGRIKRITAALLIDDVVTHGKGSDGKTTTLRVKRSPGELQQIQTLAQNTIGIDVARGDVITVQNMTFATSPELDVPAISTVERFRKGIADYSTAIRYSMLLLLFLLGYVLMIRPIQKKILTTELATLDESTMLPEAASPLPLPLPGGTTAANTRALKDQVIQQVTLEPARNARLLQAWLKEEAK